MTEKISPKTTDELIAALADGELELCQCPELFATLADDPCCGRKLADQKRLRDAVCGCLEQAQPCCPDELKAKIMSLCGEAAVATPAAAPATASARPAPAPTAAHTQRAPASPVLARIGRWAPAAVAAVMLFSAGVLFFQAGGVGSADASPAALLSVSDINRFAGRHEDCGKDPGILKDHDRFADADAVQLLPGKISDYLHRSADGLNFDLSRIGYDYQMTGACSLPGSGAVHLVYRHHDQPSRAMSLWLRPDDGAVKIQPGRLYVEAGDNLDHPVILWKANGMIYYLVGDSLEDTHKAVDMLRASA